MPFGTFLNGGTAFQLRGLRWLALSEAGAIGQRTYTSDSGGGASQTWIYGGPIPCRIDPLGASETEVADRMTDDSTHRIMVPAGTNVDANDRVSISGRGTFEVTAVEQRSAEWVRVLDVVQVF